MISKKTRREELDSQSVRVSNIHRQKYLGKCHKKEQQASKEKEKVK